VAADPYLDPVSGVLRNRLGLTNAQQLAQAEAALAAAAEIRLFEEGLALGHHDFAHLRAIHRHLFGRLYDWAGEIRTVNIVKGDTVFALAQWIEPQGEQIFADLAAHRFLRGLDRDDFILGAAGLLSDLNALHPFREGNGRTQRVFIQLLANQNQWTLTWNHVTTAENAELSRAAMTDRNAFVPLINRILT
jgi:cell filamentation protein